MMEKSTSKSDRADEVAIKSLIYSQFQSLNWSSTQFADWLTFEAGFLPKARLFPSARPIKATSVLEFKTRMENLKTNGSLASFEEKPIDPFQVRIVGKVAVAIAGCEMLENGRDTTRDTSVFLLVKDAGIWKIAAQGWDTVGD